MHIGQNIARLRGKHDLTQEELASRSGVSRATIAHIETGDRDNPGYATLRKLADALGEPIEAIFEGGQPLDDARHNPAQP